MFKCATSSKQIIKESLKMRQAKDQFPQPTRIDVFNSPKLQYVEINIQSIHLHESRRKTTESKNPPKSIKKSHSWCLILISVLIVVMLCLLIAITILLSTGFPSKSDHLSLAQRSNKLKTQNLNKFVKRSEWCKIKSIQGRKKLAMPVPKAIIMQTFTKECETRDECIKFLLKKQNNDYPKVDDIKENFFVGVDGTIYEGRGFTREGEHTYDQLGRSYNKDSIGISFIGNYTMSSPSQIQINSILRFFTQSIKDGNLDPNYSLYYKTQLSGLTTKSDQLYKAVKTFNNWKSDS